MNKNKYLHNLLKLIESEFGEYTKTRFQNQINLVKEYISGSSKSIPNIFFILSTLRNLEERKEKLPIGYTDTISNLFKLLVN